MAADPVARASLLIERAPAKVNLTLRILGRRLDGYHDIESLVAFASVADELSLAPGPQLSLTVTGPAASSVGPIGENLVLRAAGAFAARFPNSHLGDFHLLKRLPVAAGIGGGSSDAAAALRLLARANGFAPDLAELFKIAGTIGADVPVCLDPRARIMRGVGDELGAPVVFPKPLFIVLVNPGTPLATKPVFEALALAPGTTIAAQTPDRSDGWVVETLRASSNDMQPAAIRLLPAVADVLSALQDTSNCRLARMSGSGATCFGLFEDDHSAAAAATLLTVNHPSWWIAKAALS